MIRTPVLKAAAGGSLLAALCACGTPDHSSADHYPPNDPPRVQTPEARNPVQYHEDANITRRVHAAVLGVPGIHAETVQVSTYDGVVTLRGTASSEADARNAVQAARQVTGVRSVDYDIRVRP
jgi:HSP20 family molecular chaperone IbpA